MASRKETKKVGARNDNITVPVMFLVTHPYSAHIQNVRYLETILDLSYNTSTQLNKNIVLQFFDFLHKICFLSAL